MYQLSANHDKYRNSSVLPNCAPVRPEVHQSKVFSTVVNLLEPEANHFSICVVETHNTLFLPAPLAALHIRPFYLATLHYL